LKYLSSSIYLFSSSALFLRASSFSKTSLICSELSIYYLFKRLTRSCILIARCPDPAINLFKFGVTCCAFCGASGGVEDTRFHKICRDLGVNFEIERSIAFCPAFCPALLAMFKAVSTTCFLLMNPDKKSLGFEKIPEPPTYYFL